MPAETPAPSGRRAGGAPLKNRNRATHMIFGNGLPRGTSHIAQRLNTLRRELARLVEDRHGEVALYHAAVIDAVVKWERLGQLAGRWLRKEGDKLEPAEKLAFAKEIARAAVERNRAMVALGLDRDEKVSVWDQLDRQRALELANAHQNAARPDTRDVSPHASNPATLTTDASNAVVGDCQSSPAK